MKKKLTVQLVMAILLVLSGIVLLFSGFWIAPKGEIHSSVLVAFGETCTSVSYTHLTLPTNSLV